MSTYAYDLTNYILETSIAFDTSLAVFLISIRKHHMIEKTMVVKKRYPIEIQSCKEGTKMATRVNALNPSRSITSTLKPT